MEQMALFKDQRPEPKPKTSCLNRSGYYVVFETGDRPVIWGIGKSEKQAIEDALREVKGCKDMFIDDFLDMLDAIKNKKLVITKCSRKIYKTVCEFGGAIDFKYKPDIGVFLPDEVKK